MRYRIGVIEGIWTNFIPPIQGGEFASFLKTEEGCGNDVDDANELESNCSSSRTPSPVFDSNANGLTRRLRAKSDSGRASSISSQSSTDDSDPAGLSYLDAITREKISLDTDKYPLVDKATQHHIAQKYRELHEEIKRQGLYECGRWAYTLDCCRYLAFGGLALGLLRNGYIVLSAFSLGLLWHQLSFLAHDAGHMGITHNYQVDTAIGILVADFVGGLSIGWWKRNHNVHHVVTNAPEHDPDIEHMPLFAVSHRLLGGLRSTYYDRIMEYDAVAKVMLKVQPWTYYPLLAMGRFNLIRLSWEFLLTRQGPRRGAGAWHWYAEIVGQIFFCFWFGYGIIYKTLPDALSRFLFVFVSHVTASPLHVQIVLSHFAMSTADLGPQESFAQKMLRTTMDVDCPPWLDFIHGGLQFQAIHHLFPRIPRHNLRQTRQLVVRFCDEVGIPYALYGFASGNKEVIGRLAEVSRQASILAKCQQSMASSGNLYGHAH